MNSIGNRDIKGNVRILVVNNGLGQEFKNYSCYSSMLGDDTDKFIAAKGHFGNQSKTLVRSYAENLGFEYLTASNKDEFEAVYKRFLVTENTGKPMFFEVFTNTKEESEAFEMITTLTKTSKIMRQGMKLAEAPAMSGIKKIIKSHL